MTTKTARPVAYIRRSVARRNDPGDVSRQFQSQKVRELANGDSAALAIIDQDWGRSAAGDKTDKRLAFLGLLEAVERGEVSTLYAYSADRLARSVRWSAQLLDACEAAGTTIVTGEGRFAPGDDGARQMFHFQAMQNEGTLRQMTAKARAAVTTRGQRGDRLGRAPYGYRMARDVEGRVVHVRDPQQPLEPVLKAFAEAGSFNGAARMLNERGVPAPRGGKWAGNVVNLVVRRERPGLGPRHRSEPRVAPVGTHLFSRLLRCRCGRILTPRITRHTTQYGTYGPYVSYQCYDGRHDPSHPRPYMVAESAIIEWAKGEAARLRTPDRVQLGERNAERRQELGEQRKRLGWALADGLLEREEVKRRAEAIDAELDTLTDQEQAVEIPAIDWTWPRRELNVALRALWEYVELDVAQRPVRAEWTVPEWRS